LHARSGAERVTQLTGAGQPNAAPACHRARLPRPVPWWAAARAATEGSGCVGCGSALEYRHFNRLVPPRQAKSRRRPSFIRSCRSFTGQPSTAPVPLLKAQAAALARYCQHSAAGPLGDLLIGQYAHLAHGAGGSGKIPRNTVMRTGLVQRRDTHEGSRMR
jgi:hypothetical protein